MPAADVTAKRSSPVDRPERPLSRAEPLAAAWAAQDAELDAEIAALEAAGILSVPAEDGPPHGQRAWPADQSESGSWFDEYLPATADATAPQMPRTERRDGAGAGAAGFAMGGTADLLSPGAALAGLAEEAHAAGLSRLTDDELAGVIRAGRRLSSWASALELAAISDLMRRREQREAAGHPHSAEHTDAEIAALLTLTGRGAGRLLDLAIALRRLPLTTRALAGGVIDLPRVAVIADETAGLDDDHAAAVERHILVRAPGQTTSQVRAAARRAVLATDPQAARKRQEQAQHEARVERWDEHAGTAALAGRDLPPAAVIAADQHLSALARELRAAGLAGSTDQLRAQAFLALLSGLPAAALLPTGPHQPDPAASASGTSAAPVMPGQPGVPGSPGSPATPASPAPAPTAAGTGQAGNPTAAGRPGVPAATRWAGNPGAGWAGAPAAASWPGLPAVAGTVNLTMPLGTWLGLRETPGEVTGFGPLPAGDSRQLATAMAQHPQTRWCITFTSQDGRPVAHGCARPGHGPPQPPPATRVPPPQGPAPPQHQPALPQHAPALAEHAPAPAEHRSTPAEHRSTPAEHRSTPAEHRSTPPEHGPAPPKHRPAPPASGPPPASKAPGADWLAGIPLTWFEAADCTHHRQSAAYRPPPALQHLITIRHQACAFPGCRRPASQCDLDHTTPHHRGGPTCECNLAPLCRRHHHAKQARGWILQQPHPGTLTWTTPSNRTYTTLPTVYPG